MNELTKPGDSFTFNKQIFLNNYFDLEGDKPLEVKILNNTSYGSLILEDDIIKSGDIFNINLADQLQYIRLSNLAYSEEIQFQVSDNNPNKKFSNMATFTINVDAYVNLPPDSIGDNEVTINNGETKVFTVSDFTTNTTPPYDDPEGDGPYKLKILSTPADGSKILLNGVTVLATGSEVLFTDIALGKLSIQPNANLTEHSLTFDFDISDLGSQQYSGL